MRAAAPPPLLLLLLLLLLAAAPRPTSAAADGEGDADLRRRLEEVVSRRLTFKDADHRPFAEAGLLPELTVNGLRLSETLVLHRSKPFEVTRITVPPSFTAPPTARRLEALKPLETIKALPVDFDNPRVRLRTLLALNAGVMPEASFNDTVTFDKLYQVYAMGHQVFVPTPAPLNNSNGSNGSAATPVETVVAGPNGSNLTVGEVDNETTWARVVNETAALKAAAKDIRTARGSLLTSNFLGKRSEPCKDLKQDADFCQGDIGIMVSVYLDPVKDIRVLVFHGGMDSASDHEYVLWSHKVWLLELYQSQAENAWSFLTQEVLPPQFASRSGGLAIGTEAIEERAKWDKNEKPLRCAFLKHESQPIPDAEGVADATNFKASQITDLGQWEVIKKVVREILPLGRPAAEPKTYITGTGTGGTHAALVSMFIKKMDARAYRTEIIAGVGWQCLARTLYAGDTDPWETNAQIHVYSHIMDLYSSAIDRVSGTVCAFGTLDFKGPLKDYCERIIGYTAAEVVFRGGEPSGDVVEARKAFDACHYFTHSVWYAALLLSDDWVLAIDGKTDGGCKVVKPVPKDDLLGMCPDPDKLRAAEDCLVMPDTQRDLPLSTMIAVSLGLAGTIIGAGLVLKAMMNRSRDDGWVFRSEHGNSKKDCCSDLVKFFTGVGKKVDRAAEARQRAKDLREKQTKGKGGGGGGKKAKAEAEGAVEAPQDEETNPEMAGGGEEEANGATGSGDATGPEGSPLLDGDAGKAADKKKRRREDGQRDRGDGRRDREEKNPEMVGGRVEEKNPEMVGGGEEPTTGTSENGGASGSGDAQQNPEGSPLLDDGAGKAADNKKGQRRKEANPEIIGGGEEQTSGASESGGASGSGDAQQNPEGSPLLVDNNDKAEAKKESRRQDGRHDREEGRRDREEGRRDREEGRRDREERREKNQRPPRRDERRDERRDRNERGERKDRGDKKDDGKGVNLE